MKIIEIERMHGDIEEHKHNKHDYWHPKARKHLIETTPQIKDSWCHAGENDQGSIIGEQTDDSGIRVHRHGTDYSYFHPVSRLHSSNRDQKRTPFWKRE